MLLGIQLNGSGAVRNILCHSSANGAAEHGGCHGASVIVHRSGILTGNGFLPTLYQVLSGHIDSTNSANKICRNAHCRGKHRRSVSKHRSILLSNIGHTLIQSVFQVVQVFIRSILTLCIVQIIVVGNFLFAHLVIDSIRGAAFQICHVTFAGTVQVIDVIINRITLAKPAGTKANAKTCSRFIMGRLGILCKVIVLVKETILTLIFKAPFLTLHSFQLCLCLCNGCIHLLQLFVHSIFACLGNRAASGVSGAQSLKLIPPCGHFCQGFFQRIDLCIQLSDLSSIVSISHHTGSMLGKPALFLTISHVPQDSLDLSIGFALIFLLIVILSQSRLIVILIIPLGIEILRLPGLGSGIRKRFYDRVNAGDNLLVAGILLAPFISLGKDGRSSVINGGVCLIIFAVPFALILISIIQNRSGSISPGLYRFCSFLSSPFCNRYTARGFAGRFTR